jgi:hypothetical protein
MSGTAVGGASGGHIGGGPNDGTFGVMANGAPISTSLADDPEQRPTNINVMTGGAPPDASGMEDSPRGAAGYTTPVQSRGKDWALGKRSARAVPIRRAIHVVVRKDQLAIVADNAAASATAGGTVVAINGDTVEAVDQFVTQVRKHVDGWGIAGDGLYWRPVLLITVAPEGQRRADDLARLLKNSGFELRSNATAQNAKQDETHETR